MLLFLSPESTVLSVFRGVKALRHIWEKIDCFWTWFSLKPALTLCFVSDICLVAFVLAHTRSVRFCSCCDFENLRFRIAPTALHLLLWFAYLCIVVFVIFRHDLCDKLLAPGCWLGFLCSVDRGAFSAAVSESDRRYDKSHLMNVFHKDVVTFEKLEQTGLTEKPYLVQQCRYSHTLASPQIAHVKGIRDLFYEQRRLKL